MAAAETNFKELLEAMPDPVVIVEDGQIVLANREAEKKFGYSHDALLGQPIEVLLPERFRTVHVGHRQGYERNPHTRPMGIGLELFARRRDGTEFPVEISLSPSESDGHKLVISIIRDISDRKRLEREKDELLATVTHVLDGMTEPVFVVNPQGDVTRANDAAARMIGRPREEILGRPAREVFHWEDAGGRLLDDDEYLYHETFGSVEPLSVSGRYLRRLDGERIPVVISSAPVTDPEQGIRMAVQVVRDVTREREAEELKDRIISLVSHELRTPIGHIKGFASSLLEEDVTWDAETQHDFIVEIDHEADRLATLVADLLDMSKIESGKDFLEIAHHSPLAIVESALRAAERFTREHEVKVDVDPALPDVPADASQLERVICNLVENAAKYTEPNTEIRVQARRGGDAVEFSVSDHGPGIPLEYRDRIFERFFRIKTGNGGRKPGTGLGLPICRGIVEAHGGKLWYESNGGGGSVFRFTIPL